MRRVTLVLALLGGLLLVLGWKLFWLFVGVVGFAAGLQVADLYFGLQPFWVLWSVGLICGIIGAVIALFFQRLAVAVGGFVAGSTISLHLMSLLGHNAGMLIICIGGIIGAVALYLLFDWALVLLSSIIGAALMVEALAWRQSYSTVLLLVLSATGVIFQARQLIASRK
jgi:hypothetical protein